jgi:RNA polymerase sigma-70 factor, ECF subfamily
LFLEVFLKIKMFFEGFSIYNSSIYMKRLKGGIFIDDIKLISSILAGNIEDYEKLIHKYEKLVYFSLVKFFNGQKQEAEDLTQEVFISAFKSLKYFRNDSSFSTWLLRIATNKALDVKKKKKVTVIPFKNDEMTNNNRNNSLEEEKSNSIDPLKLLISKENQSYIHSLINELPVLYQAVIKDYYFKQLSYQEIAKQDGVSLKTIESRLYRARALIKKRWKEETGA